MKCSSLCKCLFSLGLVFLVSCSCQPQAPKDDDGQNNMQMMQGGACDACGCDDCGCDQEAEPCCKPAPCESCPDQEPACNDCQAEPCECEPCCSSPCPCEEPAQQATDPCCDDCGGCCDDCGCGCGCCNQEVKEPAVQTEITENASVEE